MCLPLQGSKLQPSEEGVFTEAAKIQMWFIGRWQLLKGQNKDEWTLVYYTPMNTFSFCYKMFIKCASADIMPHQP